MNSTVRELLLNIDGTYHFEKIHVVLRVNFMVKPNGQLVTVS